MNINKKMKTLKDLELLLLNLEENIYYLIVTPERLITSEEYTIDKVISLINITNPLTKEIVNKYKETFGIKSIDIDIINLIIKYLDIAGKIIKLKTQEMFGVKDLDYCVQTDLIALDRTYFIKKYSAQRWFVTEQNSNKATDVFISILIPYCTRYCVNLYESLY